MTLFSTDVSRALDHASRLAYTLSTEQHENI